jgi:large subunit ribosomal protein L1
MAVHGKKYIEAAKLVEDGKSYHPVEAAALVKKTSYVKFDATVELHLRMGVDPRHADQQVRGVALLPHGLGKQVRVLVFAQGEAARFAEEAGADVVGSDELIKKISDENWRDFDVAIATPDMMGKVGKLGRVLGRAGLMPNPKSGTIVGPTELGRAIRDARKGRVEFRVDRTALIHCPIGKVSFEEAQIAENALALVDAINKAKPTGARGVYIKNITVTSTMGPGIKMDLAETGAQAG